MEKKIQPYLHAKYKRVRDRVEKLNSRKIGLSSESSSGTEDSVAGSEDESSSHEYSKPSSSESNDFDDNLGYVPTENQPPKPNANDDDPEISLFRSNFLEVNFYLEVAFFFLKKLIQRNFSNTSRQRKRPTLSKTEEKHEVEMTKVRNFPNANP